MSEAKGLNSSFDSLIVYEVIKELGKITSVPFAPTFLVNLGGFIL